MSRGTGLVASVALALAASAGAAPPPWLVLPRGGGASPPDLSLAALELSAERRAELVEQLEAPFTDLLWRMHMHLSKDGLVEARVVQVRHFLADSGGTLGGELEFYVQPSHETGAVTAAFVIRPDGQRVDVAADTVQILDLLEPRVFSDAQRVVLPLPGLAPGATAVLVYETRFRSNEWPLPWSALFSLQVASPVENLEIEVEWEEGVAPLSWDENDAALSCESGPRFLRCSKRRGAALILDPDLGAVRDAIPHLIVARPLSWGGLAEDVREVVYGSMADGVPESLVRSLVAGADSDRARWEALYRFVAEEIRYLGLESHTASVVPRPPRVTLERRFGDCKDKVALLLALAREAGLEAHPVLVATGRNRAEWLLEPASSYFDHMIACHDTTGEPLCADVTVAAASSAESLLPIAGNAALDLVPGTPGPRRLPAVDFGWTIDVEGETKVACDGTVEGTLTRRLHGLAGLMYRQGLAQASGAERRRILEEEFLQALGYPATSVEVRSLDEPSQPLVTVARYGFRGSSQLVNSTSFTDSTTWLRYHGLSLRSENRAHPFRNPGLRVRSTLRYEICPDVEARFLGPVLELDSPFGSLQRTYAKADSGIVVTSELAVKSAEIPAEAIPRFNRFLEGSADQTEVWFSLQPAR